MPSFLTLLAQGAGAQQKPGGLLGDPMVMMVLMVVMFYFLLIRPQQKQRKELATKLAALEKGDQVVTSAGIHAIVHNVKVNQETKKVTTVVLKIAEGVLVEFDSSAISFVAKKETAAAPATK